MIWPEWLKPIPAEDGEGVNERMLRRLHLVMLVVAAFATANAVAQVALVAWKLLRLLLRGTS